MLSASRASETSAVSANPGDTHAEDASSRSEADSNAENKIAVTLMLWRWEEGRGRERVRGEESGHSSLITARGKLTLGRSLRKSLEQSLQWRAPGLYSLKCPVLMSCSYSSLQSVEGIMKANTCSG